MGSFGQSLPDQYERLSELLTAQVQAISDIRDLYKERVALDREYAGKLQTLARRASEKKSKTEASFVLGAEPTKAWDTKTLKQNSFNLAYDEIINSTLNSAQDHIDLAEKLTAEVVEVLRTMERRNDDIKKKELQFFNKLTADKERTNSERLKSKAKYDDDCGEVDSYRQKQSKSNDDRHAERAAKQSEQLRNEMLNSKNTYIICTAIANQAMAKFYTADLPTLEDELQIIHAQAVQGLVSVLAHAQGLQLNHHDIIKSRLSAVENKLRAIDTSKDQDIFIEYNIRPFSPPKDWKFEPCATFYDNDGLSVEPAPKIFLQNKLRRTQSKLELEPVMANKRREFDQLAALAASKSLENADETSDKYLEAGHQLILFTTSEAILKAEIETILSALGDDVGGQQPHTFKSSSFSIPTTCGYCKASIWGLSKQGKTCKACGMSVHTKCELKVPADCTQGEPRSSSLPPSTIVPHKIDAPTASSFVHTEVAEEKMSYPVATVLFNFNATSAFELSVSEGTQVNVLEPDDGSGWVKVGDFQGHDGLVPASYIEYEQSTSPAISAEGSGQFVQAIYAYAARGSDEIGLAVGELVELSGGINGGMHYGEGWWEGINSSGQKGIFPSNYVELVQR